MRTPIKDGEMIILPPAADCCQVCARKHAPENPHDPQSLYWQVVFHREHGRAPTWEDGLAHCTPEVRALWVEGLAKHGVIVGGAAP